MMITTEEQAKAVKILLVEDNQSDVFLIQEALKRCKHKLYIGVVYDGEEALSYLRHEGNYIYRDDPDLILLDLNLPLKNGWDVLEEIKRTPPMNRIPVVVVTASWHERDERRAHKLKADGYLVKPLNMMEFPLLIEAIDRMAPV